MRKQLNEIIRWSVLTQGDQDIGEISQIGEVILMAAENILGAA